MRFHVGNGSTGSGVSQRNLLLSSEKSECQFLEAYRRCWRCCSFSTEQANAQRRLLGSVHTATNSASGNEIQSYLRIYNFLLPIGSFSTGGTGSGDGLGNQGGLALSDDGNWMAAVNAGSGNVTGYAVGGAGELSLLDEDGITADTGQGSAPLDMALTEDSKFLFVLNSGTNEVAGFSVNRDGSLTATVTIPGLPDGANGLVAR